jgi:hypothetical protein
MDMGKAPDVNSERFKRICIKKSGYGANMTSCGKMAAGCYALTMAECGTRNHNLHYGRCRRAVPGRG